MALPGLLSSDLPKLSSSLQPPAPGAVPPGPDYPDLQPPGSGSSTGSTTPKPSFDMSGAGNTAQTSSSTTTTQPSLNLSGAGGGLQAPALAPPAPVISTQNVPSGSRTESTPSLDMSGAGNTLQAPAQSTPSLNPTAPVAPMPDPKALVAPLPSPVASKAALPDPTASNVQGPDTAAAIVKPPDPTASRTATPDPTAAQNAMPELPSEYQQGLAELAAVAKQMMSGDDPKFKAALNQAVTGAALMNSAEMDALKMQINQDPALKGQGAGLAYMSVLARDQGLNLDQVMGQLSLESMDRIINLQKYGLEMGFNINREQYGRGVDTYKFGVDQARYKDLRADLTYDRTVNEARYTDTRNDLTYNRTLEQGRHLEDRLDLTYERDLAVKKYTDIRNDLTYNNTVAQALHSENRDDLTYKNAMDQALHAENRSDLTYKNSLEQSRHIEDRADITYDRMLEEIRNAQQQSRLAQADKERLLQSLLGNGQFSAAASAMQKIVDETFPGSGIHIDESSLKGRDPQTLVKMGQQVDFIRDIAATNPAAALPLVQSLMKDPDFAGYFPPGATAEQIVASMGKGAVGSNIVASEPINKSINALALGGQSFDETGNSYAELFRLTGRNAVNEGRKLDLDTINVIRALDGLPAFTKAPDGSILDEMGMPLDDQDYTELAYRKDYADRVKKGSEKPWESMRSEILSSPMGKYFLDENLYPGANDSLNKFLMAYSLSADAFTKDPQTGEIVPNWDKLNLSLTSPEMWPIFHNWPTAAFDEKGNVTLGPDGKPVFTQGGYVYGEEVNGQKILSTPADQQLDQAYFAYRNTGGKMSPQEWYFATGGGQSRTPDPSKIPQGVAITPGLPGDPKPGTPGQPATDDATIEAILKDARLGKTLTPEQEKSLLASGKLPEWTATSLKVGQDAAEFVGEMVNIGGTLAKVMSSGNYKTESATGGDRSGYVELQIGGKTYWYDSLGQWFNAKPEDKERLEHTNSGKLIASPLEPAPKTTDPINVKMPFGGSINVGGGIPLG